MLITYNYLFDFILQKIIKLVQKPAKSDKEIKQATAA
jgi:hypothetical protein